MPAMDVGETLYVTDASQWRAWLAKHHATKREVWLVFFRKEAGKPSIPYGDAVDEALCFGWIDSVVKPLGPSTGHSDAADGARAQRFTPRRPGSPLSEANKERARRMVKAGRMTPGGLAAIGGALDEPFVLPPDIERELRADETVWHNFEAFPEGYRRIRVGFIDGSRNRSDFFRRRLDYFIRMTRQNKRFGILQ